MIMKKSLLLILLLVISACGNSSSSSSDIFSSPLLTAVDSTNNRLFVFEKNGNISIFEADDRSIIGDRPFVDSDTNEEINDLLPNSPTYVVVQAIGETSRLFISGTQSQAVSNQIIVLDFNGTDIETTDFSPIEVGDDSDAIINGLAINSDQNHLYLTSSTNLFIYNSSTGVLISENAISGSPQRMAVDGNNLYVANASSETDEQGVTIIDVTEDPIDTTLAQINPADDRDQAPIKDVAVLTTANGTIVLASDSTRSIVYVQTITNNEFSPIAIELNNEDDLDDNNDQGVDGEINTDNGISSTVGALVLSTNEDDDAYGYVAQSDGRIQRLSFPSDLSTYSSQGIFTGSELLQGVSLFINPDDEDNQAYFASPEDGNILIIESIGNTDSETVN